MRDYKRKMNLYRIPKDRYRELRQYCLCADRYDRMIIESAIADVTDEVLGSFILRHVLSTDCGISSLQADGLPCNADTFRIYRAKFFWLLDQRLKYFGR